MALKKRLSKALQLIGAVTVLGLGLLVGGALYLMWDARRETTDTTEFATDTESSASDPKEDETSEITETTSFETDGEQSTAGDASA